MGGSKGCGIGSCICFLLVAGTAGALAWYFTAGNGDATDLNDSIANAFDFIWSISDFEKEAPFEEVSPNEVPRWPNNGQGIELQIQSALEDRWSSYFEQAVSDWDSGSPDVLTLTSTSSSYDPDCTPIDGLIKVCNNDYGDTGWYGINEISAIGKEIVSSIAKMNDYYFSDDASDQAERRQYTMCHEMGHGFGLPHTDESFTNTDDGECMDYTDSPENNMHPNQINFDFLNNLYGDGTGSSTSAPTSEGTSSGGGRRRSLRQLPDWVQEEWRQISAASIGARNSRVPAHWRKLRSNELGDVHEVDLGEGYRIIVERLLPHWLN
ncbi:hypothetical protein MPSEU_000588000 [Mayamaea pseudoterrestris]|nr:hypothetical protein MPSEU_000588000 [Mayamaea pseudoterrestris]